MNSSSKIAFLLNSAGPWQHEFLFGEKKANNLKTRNTLLWAKPGWAILWDRKRTEDRFNQSQEKEIKKKSCSYAVFMGASATPAPQTRRVYSRSLLYQEIELRE